jgi:hypothetical protein
MTYHRVYNKSNTAGATSGAGIAYPPSKPVSSLSVRVPQSLVFCLVSCRSLFILLVIILPLPQSRF